MPCKAVVDPSAELSLLVLTEWKIQLGFLDKNLALISASFSASLLVAGPSSWTSNQA